MHVKNVDTTWVLGRPRLFFFSLEGNIEENVQPACVTGIILSDCKDSEVDMK